MIEDARPQRSPRAGRRRAATDDGSGAGNGEVETGAGIGECGSPAFETELPKKLGELVKFAEEHQLFDADTLEAWRKPGTKKADVAAEIKAALEQKQAEGQEGA
jgi:hypothetical protein